MFLSTLYFSVADFRTTNRNGAAFTVLCFAGLLLLTEMTKKEPFLLFGKSDSHTNSREYHEIPCMLPSQY